MNPWLVGAAIPFVLWLLSGSSGYFRPQNQRIYLLGDSLSVGPSSPGGQLAQLLRNAGAAVEVNAVGGWTALQFMRERQAEILADIARFRPTQAVFFLGTNEEANLAAGGNEQKLLEAHRLLYELFARAGVPVVELGPPQVDPSVIRGRPLVDVLPGLYQQLSRIYGNRLVDTRPFAKPRQGDVHFSTQGAALFARDAFKALTGSEPVAVQAPKKGKAGVLQWAPQVNAASAETGVPRKRIYGTIEHESGGNQFARSNFTKRDGTIGHAYGLMQLIPETANRYGVVDIWNADENVLAGARLLRDLFNQWGSWEEALASYYAGAGNVKRYGWGHYADYVASTLEREEKYKDL